MKIGIGERFVNWRRGHLYITPSLSTCYARTLISNLDTNRLQKHIEIDVHFEFLFFSSLVELHIMWGDEGEIEEEDFSEYTL